MSIPHFIPRQALEATEVLDGVNSDCGRCLDLDGMENMPFLYHEVNLALLCVAIEPNISNVSAGVHITLENLRHHEGLKYVPRDSANLQLLGRDPPSQVANKPRVHKI